MRKIIVTEFLSLDGVMEDPAWTFPYWNDGIAGFKAEETTDKDLLLLGRITWQAFARAWPSSKDEGAAYFNGVRKYVVSNTLDRVDWNNSVLISGDIVKEVSVLKQQGDENLVVHGSATLVRTLLHHNLVDRLRLLVYPVVIGKGKRLFDEESAARFNLTDTRTFTSGVVGLIYEPARA